MSRVSGSHHLREDSMRHMTISRMAFLGLLPLVLVACGNPTKKDLADMEARLQMPAQSSVVAQSAVL